MEPVCEKCKTKMVKNELGKYTCPSCKNNQKELYEESFFNIKDYKNEG